MRNDNDGAGLGSLNAIACWIDILYSDGMGARINLNGRIRDIEDICVDDLLQIVDEAEGLISTEIAE